MITLDELKAANAQRWARARLTRKADAVSVASRLIDPIAKTRYELVEAKTGVPWFVIAVIHERESSQSWKASLAQGDPWSLVSIHVPTGRGPFKSWEDAAIDALVNCKPYLAHHPDWSMGGTLAALESYNGLGYASRGLPSPYLWAGTDQYVAGKFVRDGFFDPNKVDQQLGCAALLIGMMALGAAIAPATRPPAPPVSPQPIPAPMQPPVPPASPAPPQGSWLAALISTVIAAFRRK